MLMDKIPQNPGLYKTWCTFWSCCRAIFAALNLGMIPTCHPSLSLLKCPKSCCCKWHPTLSFLELKVDMPCFSMIFGTVVRFVQITFLQPPGHPTATLANPWCPCHGQSSCSTAFRKTEILHQVLRKRPGNPGSTKSTYDPWSWYTMMYDGNLDWTQHQSKLVEEFKVISIICFRGDGVLACCPTIN